MRTYPDGVVRMIAEDAIRARLYAGVRLDRIPSNEQKPFNLKEVRRISNFDPLHRCRPSKISLPLVRSFNELRTSVDQYRPLLSTTWERDSFVITKRIRTGVKLKIYAKTNHRIRVEVVHDLTKASLRNQAVRRIAAARAGHTFATLRGVYNMLETLRDNAAKDVNDMFRHLKSQVSLPSTPLTAIDLLFDMVKVLLSRNDTRTLIDILVTKGSI